MLTQSTIQDSIFKDDPYLEDFRSQIANRVARMNATLDSIQKDTTLDKFSRGYETMGFQVTDSHINYREWAPGILLLIPGASKAYLIGDFNSWDRNSHEMLRDNYGVFNISILHVDGAPLIKHGTKVKVNIVVLKIRFQCKYLLIKSPLIKGS
jgi:1,4-alpha-glucan branching enzyme